MKIIQNIFVILSQQVSILERWEEVGYDWTLVWIFLLCNL